MSAGFSGDCRGFCRAGVLAAILLLGGLAPGLGATVDFVHADGKRLVDSRGARFDVKGINLGNWLVPEGYMFKFARARSPSEIAGVIEALIGREQASRFWSQFRDRYIAEADIRFIAAAGFNTVRVPLNWRLFVTLGSDGADRFEGPGWRLIDRLVQWCRDSALRVILDLHAAPGGQTGVNHDDGPGFPLTLYVPRDRRLTIALWRALAAHFRDEPAVLGYDLLNEPISPYSDEQYLNPRLEPLYRQIVAAIRGVDTNHLVLLAGAQWSTNFSVFGRPFDADAVYTYHKFWAGPTRAALQSYLNFSNRWNVPLLIGETGESTDAWNESFRRLHDDLGIGWCFWPYKNLDSRSAVISIEKPVGWDLIADAGSAAPGSPAPSELPPRERAQVILDAYLEAIRFENGRVNPGYLKSLGLTVP
ncbi:MAG: cellulase family glycosylhydrolase [Hyphomicrobiales bacterium]|nr:cellulase family glycosylhydrolase [Hyphomicrobiales bacterium]